MPEEPFKPLVVTIPAELGLQLEILARQERRSTAEVVCEACRRHLAASETSALDDQYGRGYEQNPEDTTDLEALMPHLPLPREDWS